ncbi:hypothetical protein NRB_00340 [Novosphingobium sp. 11B]
MFFGTGKTPGANHAEKIWPRHAVSKAADKPLKPSPVNNARDDKLRSYLILERQLSRVTLPDPDDALVRTRRQGPTQHPHMALATRRGNLRHRRGLATDRRVGRRLFHGHSAGL